MQQYLHSFVTLSSFSSFDVTMRKENSSDAEFKEFEPRLIFETRLKYGWLVPPKIVFNVSRFKPALN